MMSSLQFLQEMAKELRPCVRSLVLTDLVFKLLAFWLLTPLFGLLLQLSLWFSGNPVLSDLDIATFLLGPIGWLSAIWLGACWLGIVALEQVALLGILAAGHQHRQIDVRTALLWTLGHVVPVLRVSGRLVAWTLLLVAPFAIVAGVCYMLLLNEFDINYYLKQRPWEFKLALVLGGVLALGLVAVLIRFYSSCFLALQLVIFDRVPAGDALRASRVAVGKRRLNVLHWLGLWVAVVFVLNALVTMLAGWIGQQLMPSVDSGLAGLTTRVGLMVLVFGISSLLVNVVITCLLASLLFCGYLRLQDDAEASLSGLTLQSGSGAGFKLLTRFRVGLAFVLLAPVAALLGFWLLDSMQAEHRVLVMAHRGASHVAPENTLAAIKQAIEDQADWVEIDVQETADGQVVVVHDSDFMKLSKNPLKIWDAQLKDLEEIDIGSWFDPKFAEERVLTLEQVLQVCKDRVGVVIELKYYGHDEELEQRVIDIVESLGMAQQIMVMSLKPDKVAIVKELRPDWKCGVLMSVSLGNLKDFNVDFLAVNASFVGRQFINCAHQAGKEVFVWTVNDSLSMSAMMNKGVDGILTDRPDLAREVMQTRADMNGVERLLLEIASLLGKEPRVVEQ